MVPCKRLLLTLKQTRGIEINGVNVCLLLCATFNRNIFLGIATNNAHPEVKFSVKPFHRVLDLLSLWESLRWTTCDTLFLSLFRNGFAYADMKRFRCMGFEFLFNF